MRKNIMIICLFLTAIFLLCSCEKQNVGNNASESINNDASGTLQEEENFAEGIEIPKKPLYESLFYGSSDPAQLADTKIEYEFIDREKYANAEIPSHKTITMGTSTIELMPDIFVGEEKNESVLGINTFPVYCYDDKDKNMYWFNPDGELVFYFLLHASDEGTILDQKQCVEIAEKFASSIIDISAFEMSVVYNDNEDLYEIKFYKFVSGIESSEYIEIDISNRGEIQTYKSQMLGMSPSPEMLEGINIEDIKASALYKANSLFPNRASKFDKVEYLMPYFKCTILKDGNLGFVSTVDIHFINELEEGRMMLTERLLIVTIVNTNNTDALK